jgi:HK97 family phage major capsid protein
LSALDKGVFKNLPRPGKNRLPKGYKRQWGNDAPVGHFLQDVCQAGQGQMASGEFHAKLKTAYEGTEWYQRISKAVQGMQEGVLSEGGALVIPEFRTTVFDHSYDSDLWGRSDQYSVSGNTITFPRLNETSRANGSRAGGLRGYWVGEGDTITASKPRPGEFVLKLKKAAVVVYLTDELMQDASVLQQWVEKKVDEELNFLLGDAIVNGNGAGRPLGILQSAAKVEVAKETGQLANTITAVNVMKMWARLAPRSMSKAVWLINQDIYPQLFQMQIGTGTSGQVVFLPPGGLSSSPFGTLYGRPIVVTEFNSTLGTAGDIVLWDPTQYVTVRKGLINRSASTHVEFLTDQVALKFTLRVDGAPWENSPVTPYKGTDTISSIVTLATRA